jgi:hypothetical protein
MSSCCCLAFVLYGRWSVPFCSFARKLADGVLHVLYGSRPMAYSAPRLSPGAAYGRHLLYAAALSTPSTSSCDRVRRSRRLLQTTPLRSPGAWREQRSGIKGEAAALGRNGGQPRSQRCSLNSVRPELVEGFARASTSSARTGWVYANSIGRGAVHAKCQGGHSKRRASASIL